MLFITSHLSCNDPEHLDTGICYVDQFSNIHAYQRSFLTYLNGPSQEA